MPQIAVFMLPLAELLQAHLCDRNLVNALYQLLRPTQLTAADMADVGETFSLPGGRQV